MSSIYLGRDKTTGKSVYLPTTAFDTHVHMPGATGKGKSTAILTMLCQLLLNPYERACHVVVDFLGGLTFDLLLWMSSKWCPKEVRDRLVLIKPAYEDRIITANPLLYDTEMHGFFKVNRGTELVLRAWDAQNLGEQPRLARWLFNAFWGAAKIGLTIGDTRHAVMPGSEYHRPFLDALPDGLRMEWHEILQARSGEAVRILDSTRNRMKPFYDGALSGMFSSEINRLDALRFMREGKIVVLCLAPENRLSPQDQSTIAGLTLNEFLATARSLGRNARCPTYLWLDEFQRMVTPDLEFAIPEMRQLGVKLILAHQSFSQLKRGNCDLSGIIWQPQTRIVFGEQGDDADLLAHEFASITYDPREILDELFSIKQLETGKKLVELKSWGVNEQDAAMWNRSYATTRSTNEQTARRDNEYDPVRSRGTATASTDSGSTGGSRASGRSDNTHQQLVSELATIRELSRRTFYTFEQKRQIWARDVRTLRTGSSLLRPVNDDTIYPVQFAEWKPGYLSFDIDTIARNFPEALDAYHRLIEENFASDLFVSPQQIERETRERLERVLRPKITVVTDREEGEPRPENPFGS